MSALIIASLLASQIVTNPAAPEFTGGTITDLDVQGEIDNTSANNGGQVYVSDADGLRTSSGIITSSNANNGVITDTTVSSFPVFSDPVFQARRNGVPFLTVRNQGDVLISSGNGLNIANAAGFTTSLVYGALSGGLDVRNNGCTGATCLRVWGKADASGEIGVVTGVPDVTTAQTTFAVANDADNASTPDLLFSVEGDGRLHVKKSKAIVAGDCDAAAEVGVMAMYDNTGASQKTLCVCEQTGASTYAWGAVSGAGSCP